MGLSRDGIAGLVLLALSLALLADSFNLPYLPLVPVGPGFYPRIVLVFMAAASALLLAQDWLRRGAALKAAEAAAGEAEPRRRYELVAAIFAVVAVYAWLLPYLGFRVSTALFVGAMQWALERPATLRQWAVLAGVALGTVVVTYFVFETYLLVLLPRGSLTGW